jgi:hypothetical protein
MPARLVSVKAVVELGYPYEVEASLDHFSYYRLMADDLRVRLSSSRRH